MKNFLSIIGTISLTSVVSTNIVACSKPTPSNKIDLDKYIREKDLGPIIYEDLQPNKDELLFAIQSKNEDILLDNKLKVEDFEIVSFQNFIATIRGVGSFFAGQADLKFSNSPLFNLEDLIKNPNLGKISFSGDKPTKAELYRAFIVLPENQHANILNPKYFVIDETATYDDKTATIIGVEPVVQGRITFTYQREILDLKDVITDNQLDELYIGQNDAPTEEKLKGELKEDGKNPRLNVEKISITEIGSTTAKVISSDDSYYVGTKDLSFSSSNFKPFDTNSLVNTDAYIQSVGLNKKNLYVGMRLTTDSLFFKPKTEANFKRVNGVSGVIYSILTVGENTVYVGSKSGVLYKSEDGEHFQPMSRVGSEQIYTIAKDDKDNVYVGSENGNVYKSEDGKTFKPMTGLKNDPIYALAFSKDKHLYAGGKSGKLYQSADQKSFSETATLGGEIWALATGKKDNLYAGSENGKVYKSTDKGKEFKALAGTEGRISSLAVTTSGIVYAGSFGGDVYKSSDGEKFKAMTGIFGQIAGIKLDTDETLYVVGSDERKNTGGKRAIYLSEKIVSLKKQ